jgi:hypothetical protein
MREETFAKVSQKLRYGETKVRKESYHDVKRKLHQGQVGACGVALARSRALTDCEAMSGSTHLTGLADGRGRGGTRDGVGALAYVHPSASTVVRSRPRRTAIRYIYAFSGCLPRREAGHTRWDLGSPGSGHNLGRFPVADGREFVEVHVALLLTRLLIHLALRSLAPREMFEALRDLRKGRKALAI